MISHDRLVALPAAIALLVTPLLFNRHVYDFTRWPRLLLLQVCVILGLAGLALLSDSVRRRSLFDTAVIAFAAWSVFSVFWSVNAVEAIVQLITLVTMVFTYKYISHLDNEDTVRDLVLIWAISGLLVALIGIGQYFGIDPLIVPTAGHPGSTFGYRNYVATYLVISIPVVTGFALFEKSPFRASTMALSTTLMLLLLLYTRTRGAWLGLAAATACALFVAIRTTGSNGVCPVRRNTHQALAFDDPFGSNENLNRRCGHRDRPRGGPIPASDGTAGRLWIRRTKGGPDHDRHAGLRTLWCTWSSHGLATNTRHGR